MSDLDRVRRAVLLAAEAADDWPANHGVCWALNDQGKSVLPDDPDAIQF